MSIDPEREAFFLHWEASMALELGSYLVGLDAQPPAWELLVMVIAARWPGWDADHAGTIRALAMEHLERAEDAASRAPAHDWLPVAIWGSAATYAARTAAGCMEAVWLDAAQPGWQTEPMLDLDRDFDEMVKRMKEGE